MGAWVTSLKRIFLGISLGIFIFVISLNVNSASATHHGTDSTYPSAITNYVDFTVNPTCSVIGTADVDKDGICDSWENSATGLIIDFPKAGGGTYHYEYKCAAAGGPDPDCPTANKRDIYLELDWMNFHEPSSGVLNDIKNAFLTAPATSDSVPAGIRLHIQYGEDTTRTNANEWGLIKYPGTTPFHVNSMKFYTATATNDGFYKVKENFFGTVQERLLDNSPPSDVLTAKRQGLHQKWN